MDFGYVGEGEIGGTTFLDLDGDGVQDDDEPGVPGSPVTITSGGDLTFTTITDENGDYLVDGLPDGDYQVIIGPDGLPGAADTPPTPTACSTARRPCRSTPKTAGHRRRDFGYQGDNGVGDTVYVGRRRQRRRRRRRRRPAGADAQITVTGTASTVSLDR